MKLVKCNWMMVGIIRAQDFGMISRSKTLCKPMTCYDLTGVCYSLCLLHRGHMEQGGGRHAGMERRERDELTRLLVRGGKDIKKITEGGTVNRNASLCWSYIMIYM